MARFADVMEERSHEKISDGDPPLYQGVHHLQAVALIAGRHLPEERLLRGGKNEGHLACLVGRQRPCGEGLQELPDPAE
jgi:hypothetical protein